MKDIFQKPSNHYACSNIKIWKIQNNHQSVLFEIECKSKGWQGCSLWFHSGFAIEKSLGAGLPALGNPHSIPSLLLGLTNNKNKGRDPSKKEKKIDCKKKEKEKKSPIWETPNLLTDVDSSTNIFFSSGDCRLWTSSEFWSMRQSSDGLSCNLLLSKPAIRTLSH